MENPQDKESGLTDGRRAALAMALGMYTGERCPYCLKTFDTIDSLDDAVWNGYTEHGRIAHRLCYEGANAK